VQLPPVGTCVMAFCQAETCQQQWTLQRSFGGAGASPALPS